MILTVVIAISTWCFSISLKEESFKNEPDKVVTILLPYVNMQNLDSMQKAYLGIDLIEDYVKLFNSINDEDFEIKISTIDEIDFADYSAKRNSILLSETQPELFFVSNALGFKNLYSSFEADKVIQSGVAADLSSRLENHDQLYDSLRNDYYVPIGIMSSSWGYRVDTLENLGIGKLPIKIGREGRIDLVRQWIMKRKPEFDYEMFNQIYNAYFSFDSFFSVKTGGFEIDVEQKIEQLNEMKSFFENRLITYKSDLDYDEFTDIMSKPLKEMIDKVWERHLESDYYLLSYDWDSRGNYSNAKGLNDGITFSIDNASYNSVGLMVNKNGGDIEQALKFIDFCISYEAQLRNSKVNSRPSYGFQGHVNSNILEELKVYEVQILGLSDRAQKIRNEFYKSIESNEIVQRNVNLILIKELYVKFKTLAVRYIFDDISEDDLRNELNQMKSKYDLMILE